MSHATQQPSSSCPHELRPGTTVCLHCRFEARSVARRRRKKVLLKGSSALAVLSTLGTMGVVGRVALHSHTLSPHVRIATAAVLGEANGESAGSQIPAAVTPALAQPDSTRAAPANQAAAAPRDSGPPTPVANPTPAPTAAASAPATPVAKPRPTPATPTPVVPQGQSLVADSLVVTRSDSVVTLSFDRSMIRTRIADKFERLVRTTLPAIYGAVADSALARIPEGGLARQGDLINDLPVRGLRIPVAPGMSIALYPIARQGRDGPLVTQYRALVVRD